MEFSTEMASAAEITGIGSEIVTVIVYFSNSAKLAARAQCSPVNIGSYDIRDSNFILMT